MLDYKKIANELKAKEKKQGYLLNKDHNDLMYVERRLREIKNQKEHTKLSDPVLECDWNLLTLYNSSTEKNRVIRINPNLRLAQYPLTREYLNSYFDNNKFSFSNYSSFIYDCSASMYSFFVMTFGFKQSGHSGGSQALPAVPGGGGISYGFNPFFGLFDNPSLLLWLILIGVGIVIIKKS